MIWLFSGLAIVVFACAAVTDVQKRRISNRLVLLLVVLAIGRMLLAPEHDMAGSLVDILIGVALFVAGAVLFQLRLLGGGDVKLLAAGALWLGAAYVPEYLFATAVAGGALALFYIVWSLAVRATTGRRVKKS